ncbi:lanthionine synthetase LanC family protein [Christiangramia sp. LLG6405-1]|uniref:lanthionine synthetase LanC family protein n=1 Tax=Christiangramia sp. LLG6405-1 TaxID=3160832 RepID=UPI003868ED5F
MEKIDNLLINIASKLINSSTKNRLPTMDENLGSILFLANYYNCTKDVNYKNKALEILNNSIDSFSNQNLKSGIYEGFDGFAYLAGQLDHIGILESENLLVDFIPHLEKSLKADLPLNNFDVLYGSMGKFQFILHCTYISKSRKISLVDNFVNNLFSNRLVDEKGTYWYENSKKCSINLGLAHGIPGILIFLSHLEFLGYKNPYIKIMIDGLQRKIMSLENHVSGLSSFGTGYVGNTNAKSYSRLGWCYGDLGIIYALLYSASISNSEYILEKCAVYIEIVLSRDLCTSGVIHFHEQSCFDPGFCHGISGIVYILIRIKELFPHEKITKRIQYWNNELIKNVEKVLDSPTMYYPDLSLSGEKLEIYDKSNFLNGLSGVGLTLLSSKYNIRNWSQFFLLY